MAKIYPGPKTTVELPDRYRPASPGFARTVLTQPPAVFLNPGGSLPEAPVVPTANLTATYFPVVYTDIVPH